MVHGQICQIPDQLNRFFIIFPKRDPALNISNIYHQPLAVPIQDPHIPVQGILSFIFLHMDQFAIPQQYGQLMIYIGIQ